MDKEVEQLAMRAARLRDRAYNARSRADDLLIAAARLDLDAERLERRAAYLRADNTDDDD